MFEFLSLYAFILQRPEFFFPLLALAGLFAGSFCTVLIHRMPLIIEGAKDLSLSFPASHCTQCKKKIPFYYNIPLVGYVFTGGRCSACHKPIDPIYPVTELMCMALAIFCGFFWGASLKTLTILPLLWGLFALAIIDFRHGLLPDVITLTLLWLGLIANAFYVWTSPSEAILGASMGYLVLFTINALYRLVRKTDGMGGGDMKLLALLGAYFGVSALLPLILMASIGGCLAAALISLVRRKMVRILPWGPFLACSGAAYAFLLKYIAVFF